MGDKRRNKGNYSVGSQNKDENSSDVTEKMSECASSSVWQYIINTDVYLTNKLAVCSVDGSLFGKLRPFMIFLEYSCHGIPWLFGTACAIFMTHKPYLHELQINLFSDLLAVTTLKSLVRRDRPSHNKMDMFVTVSVDKYSFPSGHTTRAAMLMCLFIIHFSSTLTWNYLVVLWAVAVSISRVLLGRHHVLDVLFGFLIGILQYGVIHVYLWIPRDKCEAIVSFIEEDFHL